MPEDIFDFWSPAMIQPDAHVHPADAAVLSGIDHGFDLTGIPGCWMGPLLNLGLLDDAHRDFWRLAGRNR